LEKLIEVSIDLPNAPLASAPASEAPILVTDGNDPGVRAVPVAEHVQIRNPTTAD
jgi:hypothetical protein